ACGGTGESEEQRQRVVPEVFPEGERETDDRREDAQPPPASLEHQPEQGTEDPREHRVPAEPEQRVAPAELHAPRRDAELGVALGPVERPLEPPHAETAER